MPEIEIACVVGARPNFMKMAPLLRELDRRHGVRATLIHTGQHYDSDLSDVFFRDLGMRKPDVSLDVGTGPQGAQLPRLIERLDEAFAAGPKSGRRFDRVVVVGDVNSTMAAALSAARQQIPLAHVEAGLRSFDRTMPEEINRIVTDSLSDLLLVSEPAGVENLRREGRTDAEVFLVGNLMIDTLRAVLPAARDSDVLDRLGLAPGGYGVVTLHRPANVDDRQTLSLLSDVLIETASRLPLVFPVHPRTRKRLDDFGLGPRLDAAAGIRLIPPAGYLEFLALTSQARVIITDSGGLQEESTVLGVPCLTMRPNTERPVTVELGSSTLVGSDPELLRSLLADVLEGRYKRSSVPELWDGRAAGRIAAILTRGC